MAAHSASAILQGHARALEGYFQQILERYADAPGRLMEAVAYSLLAGGKRLRPALVMETYAACRQGSDSGRQSAMAAAAAVELIHTFSLVHDDLPAMDNDDLRRGRPTNHKVFGEAMAILAGDAMVTMAFDLLAADASPGIAPALVGALALASGPVGMIGGQVLDMEGETRRLDIEELQRLHRKKTGALLVASCRMGAIAAGADAAVMKTITDFGRHLGLAFQIVDDLLDVTATPEQVGKATHKDARKGKNTYPALLGIDGSRVAANGQLSQALAAAQMLGQPAEGLVSLARFVVERDV